MILVINNLSRPEIGQSRVVEQVVRCLERSTIPFVVLRASSSVIGAQLWLITRVFWTCLWRNIQTIYYTPSRAQASILRDVVIYLVSLASRRQLVVHWHGRDIDAYNLFSSCWQVRIAKKIMDSSTHICIAEQQAEQVKAIWPKAETVVIPNTVDEAFLADIERLVPEERNRPDRKRVVMLGNLMMSKGVGAFCDIAKAMAGEDADFYLYGPFADDELSSSQAVRYLVEAHSRFLTYHGPVYGHDKVRALLDADIFLFPSQYRSEALPLVVLEALAAGCRVIASDIGYLREIDSPHLVLVGDATGNDVVPRFADAVRSASRCDEGIVVDRSACGVFETRLLATLQSTLVAAQ